MTLEEMRERKRELGYTNRQLAELTGIPVGTLQKVMAGETKAPRRETIAALESVLKPGKREYADRVAEAAIVYGTSPRDGYTLEDYLALPEDQRVELIDGVFYDMAAPTTVHQAIGGFMYKILLDHVLAHGGECMPFMAPVDVQLDRDDRTVVQPDVMIVCDRSMFKNGRVFGAPDFLVEVLSPSTRKKDMQLKLYKYANAGVREYWMVDPEHKCVVVYDMENLEIPAIYGFGDEIPVGIWNGECRIDFGQIWGHISFLAEQ